jgi:glycerol-3-phosphate dehydrogenase (NAD(P)+)
LVICSKGIDIDRLSLMSPIVKNVFPDNPVAVLSGPSFASETAKDLPTAVNIAIDKRFAQIGEDLVAAMGHKNFRPYLHFDVIGAQIGGSLKNVMAIASGIAEGRELGENARIALMTRGLAELVRLGEKMGADPMTFMGLSGLGDLTLTCNAMESRNFSLGVRLGKGESLEQIMGSRKSVTEGVHTVKAAIQLAEQHDVRMPIAQSLYNILHGDSDIPSEIDRLLSHPFKREELG